jgi:hypothetical protein
MKIHPLVLASKASIIVYYILLAVLFIVNIRFNVPSPIFISEITLSFFFYSSILTYLIYKQAFIKECEPQNIPLNNKKFAKTIAEMEEQSKNLEKLGFEKFDGFYLQRNFDWIAFVYKHKEEEIYLSLLKVGGKFTIVWLYSELNSGRWLYTNSVMSNVPRVDRFYGQIVLSGNYETMLEVHRDGLEIFSDRGHFPVVLEPTPEAIRDTFVNNERETIREVMKVPFWYVKAVFWNLFKSGKKYCQPLRNQIQAKTVKIPTI